jgi:hypothetical protein
MPRQSFIAAAQCRRCLCAILFLICLVAAGIASAQEQRAKSRASGEPLVAVINLDRSPEGALLEQHLRREAGLKWWPRRRTQGLVKSIALSTRIDLPVLEADEERSDPKALPVLIIVTTSVKESGRLLSVAMCDAERGVRLAAHRLPLKPGAAVDIEALAASVQQSLSRRSGWVELWAVPPLLSRDLVREFDDLSFQYADEIESVLLSRPGAVAVEFEHAGVIDAARRAVGRTAPIERPTPSFVLGEYRNSGSGDARRLTVSLKLRRGERDERERSQSDLTPDAAGEFIRQFAADSGKYLNGADLIVDQPATEHLLLGGRLELLREAGGWQGAWRLAEARLLLDPYQPPLRADLLTVLARLTAQSLGRAEVIGRQTPTATFQGNNVVYTSQPNPRAAEALELALSGLNAHRRGLAHIHLMLDGEEQPRTQLLRASQMNDFGLSLHAGTQLRIDSDRRIERLIAQLVDERRDALTRMFLEAARRGQLVSPEFLSGQTGEDCLSDALRVIIATQDFRGAPERTRMLVERAIAHSGQQTDASAFVAQLAASPSASLQAAAGRGREMLAERARSVEQIAARRAAAAAARPAAEPQIPEPAEPAEIEFAEVKVPWKRPGTRDIPFMIGDFQLCLPAGKADLFFGNGQLWLMKASGEAKLLLHEPDREWSAMGPTADPGWACFDGRYAWIPLTKRGAAQRLLLVDPESEKLIEWSEADGLPLAPEAERPQSHHSSLAVAPLAAGKVCIAGSSGRGWLATAEYDPKKGKSANVFFEARQEASQTDQREALNRNLAFRPAYIFTLAGRIDDQQASQRVIVGRITGNYRATDHPLLVDPETGTVEVVQSPLKNFIVGHATAHGDAMYWTDTKYVFDQATGQQKRETRANCLGYPDFKEQLLHSHGDIGAPQTMSIGFDDAGMHCVGTSWLTADAPDQPLRLLRGKLPVASSQAPIHRWKLAKSANHGWIIYSPGRSQAYAAIFKKDAASPQARPATPPSQGKKN